MDERKKEAFAAKMTDILNYGALNLGMALGYRLGLFEAMAGFDGPVSGEEVAEASGMHHRYVREWLGIMGTAGIVEIESGNGDGERYLLPKAHAAFLTRSGNSNMGVYTQEIPLLTEIAMEAVASDFSKGQGVPFSSYPRFQSFMAELSHAKHRDVLMEKFLPHVADGGLVKRLQKGIRVCDLGCGQGIALHLMAKAFPASSFAGIDNDGDAIRTARDLAREQHLSNLEFREADAALLGDDPGLSRQFDYIMAFDAVHDQTRPLEALKCVRHLLAPGGWFSMIDIDAASDISGNLDHPMGPFLYTVSLMHCMPVGLNDDGRGLGMMWGRDRAVTLLKQAGFDSIQVLEMAHDPFNVHYFCMV